LTYTPKVYPEDYQSSGSAQKKLFFMVPNNSNHSYSFIRSIIFDTVDPIIHINV